MVWWWIATEVCFVAFFVYGYIIYRRRVKANPPPTDKPGDNR